MTTGPGAAVVAGADVVVAAVSVCEKACINLSTIELSLFSTTLDRAGGITVAPGTNSGDMVVVGVSLCGAPRCRVSIDGGAAKVGDSHVVEGEDTGRAHCRSSVGEAAGTAGKLLDFLLLSIYKGIICNYKDFEFMLKYQVPRTSASHRPRARPGGTADIVKLVDLLFQ